MCKKLFVLVVVVALSIPASADYIGVGNPLKVDIDGDRIVTPRCGWQSWLFQRDANSPINQTFDNPLAIDPWEIPAGQLDVYRLGQDYILSSRTRCGGFAFVAGTGEFSPTSKGFGMNYLKLTLTGLEPSTNHKFYLWSCDGPESWEVDPCNPDSKFGCWSTTKPKEWLDAHWGGIPGEPPDGGYGPPAGGGTDSNMPGSPINPYPWPDPSLYDLVLGCGAEGGRCSLISEDGVCRPLGSRENYVEFYADTDSSGTIVIYGWIDPTDWTGSMYMPLNGFMVVPEPASITLLGLGGLTLLRKRRK